MFGVHEFALYEFTDLSVKASYLPLCAKHLPDYSIVHIGFSINYARQFMKVPNVSFSMMKEEMVGARGAKFMADCRAHGRKIFLWTLGDEQWMRWAICKGVDGVLVDDPKKFMEVCERYDEKTLSRQISWGQYGKSGLLQLLVAAFGWIVRLRFGFYVKPEELRFHGQPEKHLVQG